MLIPLCGCVHGLVTNFWQAECRRHKPVSHWGPAGSSIEDPSLVKLPLWKRCWPVCLFTRIYLTFVNSGFLEIVKRFSTRFSPGCTRKKRKHSRRWPRFVRSDWKRGKNKLYIKNHKNQKWLKAKTNSLSKAIKNQKTLKKVTKICSIWLKAKTNSPARTSRLVRFE